MGQQNSFEVASVKLSGKTAIVGLFVLLLLGGYRFSLMGDSKDPALYDIVYNEIELDLQREVYEDRDSYDMSNADDVAAFLENSTNVGLEIVNIAESKPIFSIGSNQKVIVRVRYRAFEEPEVYEEYHRLSYSTMFGWRYDFSDTKVGYMLNFW